MDALHWLNQKHVIYDSTSQAIIPLVLIPLTSLTVVLTSLAGIIAGWFGIKLHTEGPKQFLEVLLKKNVIISMLLLNFSAVAVYKGYVYLKTLPRFISTITKESDRIAKFSDKIYPDSLFRRHDFTGAINNQFQSLNLEKESKIAKGAFRSGVVSGDSIFYGSDDGHIYELSKIDLSVIRKFFIGTEVTTRPIIYDNKIYSGEGSHHTHHARIYSFDLKTGKFLNAFSTKGHTEGQPVIAKYLNRTLLFLTAGSDGLYAIDPITMKEVWHQIDGHLDATVTIEGGIVYAGTGIEKGSLRDRRFATAYDFLTGKRVWKKELPLSNWMHPIITETSVCFTLGEIYFPSTTGLIQCLNKHTGEPIFSIPSEGPIASKAFYIRENENEYIFFGDLKDHVCGVNLTKKEKMWCKSVGGKSTSSSLASFDYDSNHGVLWYPSFNNGLFAINPKTGETILHWMPSKTPWGEAYGAVSIDENHLYQMNIDGIVRKFKIN